jgi:antitoxin VapB
MSGRNRVSLNIKSQEVYSAAIRLARLQGTTITGAVLGALQEALLREDRRKRPQDEIARMEEISRRVAALPVIDVRSEDEILGYGSAGFPDGN